MVDTVVARSEVASCVIGEARGLVALQLCVDDGAYVSIVLADDAGVDVLNSATHIIKFISIF